MKRLLNNSSDSELQWLGIKLSLIFFWTANMFIMLRELSDYCPMPSGICKVIDLSPLFTPGGKIFLFILLIILGICYIAEKQMAVICLLQFLLSAIIISYHESNGIYKHATVYSVLFGVQSIAYWQARLNPRFDLSRFRIQYCVQIIVAMYMLAGISKLRASGIGWINSGELFSIQVVKNFSFIYFAHGSEDALQEGYRIADRLLEHRSLIKFFLASSLVLELFCFMALFSEKIRKGYAFALLAMHAGIKVIMSISFGMVAPPMVIFFLNPLFRFLLVFSKTSAFSKINRSG